MEVTKMEPQKVYLVFMTSTQEILIGNIHLKFSKNSEAKKFSFDTSCIVSSVADSIPRIHHN